MCTLRESSSALSPYTLSTKVRKSKNLVPQKCDRQKCRIPVSNLPNLRGSSQALNIIGMHGSSKSKK